MVSQDDKPSRLQASIGEPRDGASAILLGLGTRSIQEESRSHRLMTVKLSAQVFHRQAGAATFDQ